MSKLKRLIEAANRKCEMAWKVYSYNPEKDNELVDTSKAFDCIAAAQAHKREILEKNPNYTVEIIAESIQYKFKVGDRVLYEGDKATVVALRTTSKSPYYDVEKDKEKGKMQHPAYERELKPLQESAQKNEAVTKSNYKNIINDLEAVFKKFAGGDLKLEHKRKPNSFDSPLDTCLSVPLKDKAKLEPVKAALKKVIDKYGARKVAHENDFAYNFGESNRDGIYVGWNWNADRAFLGYAVNPDFDVKYLSEAANIDVKNPGVLEVPDGKKVDELPQSHFEKLVDKKGYAEVIRALTNLEVWNKDKNKSLSSWASNMADKLKKKFRPESAQKNEADPNAERTLLTKVSTIKEMARRLTKDNLVPQLTSFKKYVDDTYNFALKHFDESAQINETRGYTVTAELGVPDNMNNRDIEDEVEKLLRASNKINVVMDVTAERK